MFKSAKCLILTNTYDNKILRSSNRGANCKMFTADLAASYQNNIKRIKTLTLPGPTNSVRLQRRVFNVCVILD